MGENQEMKGTPEPEPSLPSWEHEYENTQLKPLREVISSDSSFDDAKEKLQERFTIRPEDVSLIYDLGAKQRRETVARLGGKGEYDYSAETLVQAAFIRHQMNERGVSPESQQAFLSYAEILERAEQQAPNNFAAVLDPQDGKSVEELLNESGQKLTEIAERHNEKKLVKDTIWWSYEYLALMDSIGHRDPSQRKPQEQYSKYLGDIPEWATRHERLNDYHAYMHGLFGIRMLVQNHL